MLRTVAVEGYRSLRDCVLSLGRLTVVTGANGAGKSNLYRVLRLLAATGKGSAVRALAAASATIVSLAPHRDSLERLFVQRARAAAG